MPLPPGLLTPDAILPRLRVGSKSGLFAAMCERGAAITRQPRADLLAAVLAREAAGTTGFGGGVALPHARLAAIARPIIVFAHLDQPIDYGALDDTPVDLVLLLLSPASGSAAHLKALASASRLLRDPSLAAKLRGASDADALCALLIVSPLAHAA